MGSTAILHAGYEQGAGPLRKPVRPSSASSTPGTTPMTGASPSRARASVMVLAAQHIPAARSRANAAIRAADHLAVRVPAARLASWHRSSQSRLNASLPLILVPYRVKRLSGPGQLSNLRQQGRSSHPAGARWYGMAMFFNWMNWTTPARSTAPLPMRQERHDPGRHSKMRASLTDFRPTTAATSSPIVSMAQGTPSITLPRMPRQIGEPIGCLSRNRPMLWRNARRLR